MAETTHKLLAENLGNIVLVKLKGGETLRGKLRSYDQHLNLVLDDAEEIRDDGTRRRLGTIIIRGDNVVLVSPAPMR